MLFIALLVGQSVMSHRGDMALPSSLKTTAIMRSLCLSGRCIPQGICDSIIFVPPAHIAHSTRHPGGPAPARAHPDQYFCWTLATFADGKSGQQATRSRAGD